MRVYKWSAVFAAAACLWAAPMASAQDREADIRLALSGELISLSTGQNFVKMLDQYITGEVAKLEDGSAESEWMRDNLPGMTTRLVQQMLEDLRPVYAETFSVAELEAQIAFYRSPIGRQIAAKSIELGVAQEAVVQASMATFLGEYETKFCAAFDCSAAATGGSTAKSRRN